jgi:hypothetical protein
MMTPEEMKLECYRATGKLDEAKELYEWLTTKTPTFVSYQPVQTRIVWQERDTAIKAPAQPDPPSAELRSVPGAEENAGTPIFDQQTCEPVDPNP